MKSIAGWHEPSHNTIQYIPALQLAEDSNQYLKIATKKMGILAFVMWRNFIYAVFLQLAVITHRWFF